MKFKKIAACLMTASMLVLAVGCNNKGNVDPSTPIDLDVSESEEPTESEEPGDVAAEDAVYNNGSEFVQVGNKVYFRNPGSEAMSQSSIGDSYSGCSGADSTFMCYDIETGECTELFTDNGYGNIYYADGFFYLTLTDSNGDFCLAKTDINGNRVSVDAEDISGCSKDGKYIAFSKFDEDYNAGLLIYKDGEQIQQITDSEFSYYVEAFKGDYMIYRGIKYDEDSTTNNLYALNLTTGASVCLGAIPEFDDFSAVDVLEQVEIVGKDAFMTIGTYCGTGHFLNRCLMCKADLDTQDSLSCEDLNFDSEIAVPAFIVENGEFKTTEGVPGTAMMNYIDGCVYVYDESGKGSVIASGYDFENPEDGETRSLIEAVYMINGRVFAIKNLEMRKAEDDIGWREAYVRVESERMIINADGSESVFATAKAK